MDQYLRKLRQTFFEEPEYPELHQEIAETRQTLSKSLDPDRRRKLLALVDAMEALQDEVSLAAFAAGIRFALGLVGELRTDEQYL